MPPRHRPHPVGRVEPGDELGVGDAEWLGELVGQLGESLKNGQVMSINH